LSDRNSRAVSLELPSQRFVPSTIKHSQYGCTYGCESFRRGQQVLLASEARSNAPSKRRKHGFRPSPSQRELRKHKWRHRCRRG
jgi:hypothetical protein